MSFISVSKATLWTTLLAAGILSACAPSVSNQKTSGLNFDSSIIGGDAVTADDPIGASAVWIYDQKRSALCTGTLIAENMVLTAAHCTNEDPTQLLIVFSLSLPQDGQPFDKSLVRQVVAGKTTDLWPNVTAQTKDTWGDIAVLRYDGTTPATAHPAAMLQGTQVLQKGTSMVLAGYGLTDGVKETQSTGLRKVTVSLAGFISQSEFAFDQSNGKGACHGDSGGPAYVQVNGQWLVAGVTSRGGTGCVKFAVYTSVPTYLTWIQSTVEYLSKLTSTEPIPQPGFNKDTPTPASAPAPSQGT